MIGRIKMAVSRLIATVVALAALGWSVQAGWRIWTTPVRYQVFESAGDTTGATTTRERFEDRAFWEESSPVPLVIPVLLSGWGAWTAWKGQSIGVTVAALLLLGYSFVTGFSIGGAYVAAGWTLVAAALINFVGKGRRSRTKEAVV